MRARPHSKKYNIDKKVLLFFIRCLNNLYKYTVQQHITYYIMSLVFEVISGIFFTKRPSVIRVSSEKR